MELQTEIGPRGFGSELSKRLTFQQYDLHRATIKKIRADVEPTGYRYRKSRPRPTIDPYLDTMHTILKADPQASKK